MLSFYCITAHSECRWALFVVCFWDLINLLDFISRNNFNVGIGHHRVLNLTLLKIFRMCWSWLYRVAQCSRYKYKILAKMNATLDRNKWNIMLSKLKAVQLNIRVCDLFLDRQCKINSSTSQKLSIG